MSPVTLSVGRRVPLFALALFLAVPVQVWAEHHTNKKPQDPVVGGLMLTDPEAFKTAIATGYRASSLLGAGVFNAAGDQVGSVNDIIVGSDLQVSLTVLSVGGFLGVGSHLVAVPTSEFERGANGEILLAGATRETLAALPEFRFME